MSFKGMNDEARQLRHFVNALRSCLGKAPLYDIEEHRIRAEEQYKGQVELPGTPAASGYTEMTGYTVRPNSFRLKRSLAAEYKRKRLNFQEPP